jgi:predicted double-glycine peptidase
VEYPSRPRRDPPFARTARQPQPEFLVPDDGNDPFDSSAARRALPPRDYRPAAYSATPPSPDASAWHAPDPRLTLPSMPRLPRARRNRQQGTTASDPTRGPLGQEDDDAIPPKASAARRQARSRERSSARPLSPQRRRQIADTLDALETHEILAPPTALVPSAATTRNVQALPVPVPVERIPARRAQLSIALVRPRVARRVRVETQRIAQAARSPWTALRFVLALAAIVLALLMATGQMGEPLQPLMLHHQWTASGGALAAKPITSLVQPETQIVQWQLYDSYQQFLDWKGAACSAATTSEVLTAWGVKNATIGQVIDKMVPDISLNGGLINEYGFQRAAAAYGFRADISHTLTYKQMRYITDQLGLPIIVNVRISYGYYHYFDTGHFLVMTAGDDQGVAIVDSSTYYIHYLPLSVFFSMFTGRTTVIVPQDYHYNVPAL